MKTILLMLLSAFMGVLSLYGQLNTLHNHYRPGDVLIKQQVEFVNPGKTGVNQVWDFSKLKTINEEYTLTYDLPPLEGDSVYILGDIRYNKKNVSDNELIVGTEHNTMYYYHLSNDSLLQTGHENPSVKLEYSSPMVLIQFPLNYGQTVSSEYKSEGLYSGTIDIQSEGTITTTADAYGKIILPSGDTLSPVLRVKTEQTILDIPNKYSYNIDSINYKGKLLETCRWYSKGYRYPVFETVRNLNIADSTTIFSTAFFYPPQDHLYLDTDPENQALLDELWKETEDNQNNTTDANNQDGKTVTLEDIMTCRIYPNPVVSHMNLEYELKEDAKVSFELYSMEGLPIRKLQPKSRTKGIYNETIDCSNLQSRNYVLRITANDTFVNEIIIKK
ncbi:hypothetical protein M2451_002668 [Dysgonomonas sp. PFB1-18]|uniref:T9SS type A sorting domain-containing protein n=1 Tax=unclassified Dysgonomonas TaxID=2630389 RepID=UPI0024756811|nr:MULTISPECIES: T9SS type A sorting domain-containing protein [unclassified Dysgonomonas]MDH6309446.1 hypothetical protein [Dysgonomonas sp. PF1-14]MDH6339689.1 hypothetical protein [Dysgonomonas sp. PF1-16]MDH6381337.1 hypothetical protein [Dysgonomonas sp. PFB1-18]MDH6398552.1 hypothetical protein [Dysgonomonas sp. PF1-23]